MKNLPLLFVCFLLIFFQSSCALGTSKKKAEVKNEDLHAKVKKQELTNVELDGFKGKVKQVKQDVYQATEKFGEVVQGARYENDGSDGEEYAHYLYIYDQKENRIQKNYYNTDGSLYVKHIYKYDEKGNQIEDQWYNSGGSFQGKCTYKYKFDTIGNMIEQIEYIPEVSYGGGKYTHKYKYDDKGNQIEWNIYTSDGSLNSKDIYKYDANGNMIEQNRYDPEGILRQTNKYDNMRNKIEDNIYSDGSLYNKTTYKYKCDDKGNMIEEISSDGSLNYKSTFKYDYDQQGNWIKKIEFENDVAQAITLREIKYY